MVANVVLVSITLEEYSELMRDSMKLQALEEAGVDNWEFYEEAMKTYREYADSEEDPTTH